MDLGVKTVRRGPYRELSILELIMCKIAKENSAFSNSNRFRLSLISLMQLSRPMKSKGGFFCFI